MSRKADSLSVFAKKIAFRRNITSYIHQPVPLWQGAAWRIMLVYACAVRKSSCMRFMRKTLIYVVDAVVYCLISVIVVVDWFHGLITELLKVNITGCSSVVLKRFLGEGFDSSKNSPNWTLFTYDASPSWTDCPYGRRVVAAGRLGIREQCGASGCVALSNRGSSLCCAWLVELGTAVLAKACTAARGAFVAMSLNDCWTVWAIIN